MSGIRSARKAMTGVALVLATLLTSGCFFDTGLSVTFAEGTVFISTNASTQICDKQGGGEGGLGFECTFFDTAGPISDVFIEALPDFLALLILIDPMVVQFPGDVTGFQGSFFHQDSGAGGQLDITSGLTTIPVDDTRALVAEPGAQLVTIELPPGTPASGDFSFNFTFDVPPGTTEVVTKPMFTGRVELTDGSVFQAPLYPCRTEMVDVPAFTIPVPAPGDTVNVPPPNPALACDGEIYRYLAVPVGLQSFSVE